MSPNSAQWAMASLFTRFLDHTQRRTTFGRTPLDEWSARRRDLYLTTLNTHNRQTSMPSVEFEPANPASERRQTHALDREATGTGCGAYYNVKYSLKNRSIVIRCTSAINSLHWVLYCAVALNFACRTKGTFRHLVWPLYLVTSTDWWIGWCILTSFQVANSDWCFTDTVIVQTQDLQPFILVGLWIPTTVQDSKVLRCRTF
jgi:hypothetical protein